MTNRNSILPLIFTVAFFILANSIFAQLTIVVDAIPSNTPEGSDIHIAGSFQGWDPASTDHILSADANGQLSITLNPSPGNLSFKFTRGSWDTVEGDENGQFLPDRSYSYSGGQETVVLQILSWEGQSTSNSTAASNVSIFSTDYYIPQLDRTRRIWVYLPPNYATSDIDYPVIYMHDGQNLFDAETSFSGEWEVDETLNSLYDQGDAGVIVVGIDNGGASRIDELSPWNNPQYGGGEGDAYMQFIINTLKPDIDATYRTLTDRDNTALIGSSLGGLISHYAAVEYESTFSKVGVFSPSYWFASEAYTLVENSTHSQSMRIYMIAGGMESGNTVGNAESMVSTYTSAGYSSDEVLLTVHPDGQHSEWYWAREFADAYEWLFDSSTSLSEFDAPLISVFPNPTSSTLHISGLAADSRLIITDSLGREVFSPKSGREVDVSSLQAGHYILRIIGEGGQSIDKAFVIE